MSPGCADTTAPARRASRWSTLTCPYCGDAKPSLMPTDACRWLYVCEACGATLRPRPGDCCVYCSYGNVACPPMQQVRAGDRDASARPG